MQQAGGSGSPSAALAATSREPTHQHHSSCCFTNVHDAQPLLRDCHNVTLTVWQLECSLMGWLSMRAIILAHKAAAIVY